MDKEGIAIQSTYNRLISSFFEDDPIIIRIGIVFYENYDDILIPQDNLYNPFIIKRKSFEYENELRVLSQEPPEMESMIKKGIRINIKLDELIERIYIAPNAQDWYFDLVKNIALKYNLDINKIFESKLSERPLY